MNPLEIPPVPETSKRRRSALVGAAVGAVTLAGVVAGVGAVGAGAQSDGDPTIAVEPEGHEIDSIDGDWAAFDDCLAGQLGDLWVEPPFGEVAFGVIDVDDLDPFAVLGDIDDLDDLDGMDLDGFETFGKLDLDGLEPFDDETLDAWEAAEEACAHLLPDEISAEMEAWAGYDDCFDNQLGIDDSTNDADFDAITDDAWKAADDACREELPDEIRGELAAFAAFEECLVDNGVAEEIDGFGTVVFVEGPDGFSTVEFGSVEGTVTISGNDDRVSISTSGDVTVLDDEAMDARWEAEEAAFETCEALLPTAGFDHDFDGWSDEEPEEAYEG